LITGYRFKTYLDGLGKTRLLQIKYKYFSDKALHLWQLCYDFFDNAKRMNIQQERKEYLLVKSFNIVFEAIIDELLGEKNIPAGLKEQADGKRIDHLYSYQNLITTRNQEPVYYIGDSKYYKLGHAIGKESVYKQFTYARNIIQWNLNLFMNDDKDDEELQYDKRNFGNVPKLRDDLTEGYNIIPNFFISAKMAENLSFSDQISSTDREKKCFNTQHFNDRLFDRDTDPRVHYVRYGDNRGACYARNLGAQQARGSILAFQDSDDLWHPDKLQKQYDLLTATGADLCYCGMNRVAAGGSSFYYPVHAPHPGRALEDFLAENRASTQTMLMHRAVWEAVRFDETIRRYQDWDFAIRAAERFRLVYLPEALVESEVGGDSISAVVKSYPHLLRLYEKHAALYQRFPRSDAVMNRRLGKRSHPTDPARAAAHFRKSFRLSHNPYDLSYYLANCLRARRQQKGQTP